MTLTPDPETGTSCTYDRGCTEDDDDGTCIDGRLLVPDGATDGWADVGPCECWCHSEDPTHIDMNDGGAS